MVRIKNKLTGTLPSVVHLAGKNCYVPELYQAWNILKDSIDTGLKTNMEPLREDTALCFYKCGPLGITMVEKSLEQFDLSITNIHKYTPYIPNRRPKHRMAMRNLLRSKPIATARFLRENRHIKYVIGYDSTDVFFLDHPNLIVQKFEKENKGIIFNAESTCYPRNALWVYNDLKNSRGEKQININTPFKFLNCGLFIARSDIYLNLYDEYRAVMRSFPRRKCYEDQGGWHRTWHRRPDEIFIDSDCEYFQIAHRMGVGSTSPNGISFRNNTEDASCIELIL